jgi:hypothetical protein
MMRERFRDFLVLYAKQVAQGIAPGRELMLACRGTPMDKDGKGGVRPIAVGDLIYNIVAKSLLRLYSRPDCLLPYQLGVRSPGGIEPVVRAVERGLEGELEQEYVVQLDFTNAYNSVSRVDCAKAVKKHCPQLFRAARWAYDAATPVVFFGQGDDFEPVMSLSGVRQGNPLSPFLFSLAIRDTISSLRSHLSTFTDSPPIILAYLDDIVILTNDPLTIGRVAKFLSFIRSPFVLNQAKSSIDSFDSIRRTGIKLLGTAVGSRDFRLAFLEKKVDEQVLLLSQLPSLSFQSALLLLRQCIQQNLRHLQRSLKTDDLDGCWDDLDSMLQRSLLILRSSPRSLITDADIISLPTRLGGLGILSHAEVAPHAHAASIESADRFLAPLLELPLVDETIPLTSQRTRCAQVLEARHSALLSSLPPLQQESLVKNASLLSRLALSSIPSSKVFHLSNREIAAALHQRTLCPSSDDACACGDSNEFGHAENCAFFPPFTTARHEIIKRQMISTLDSILSLTVLKEPPIPNSAKRTDFRVTSDAGITEYDLTIVSIASKEARQSSRRARQDLLSSQSLCQSASLPILDLSKASLQTILNKRAQIKNATYVPLLDVTFSPLVISLGGTVENASLEAMEAWKEVVGESSHGFLMRRISVVLARARARVWQFE